MSRWIKAEECGRWCGYFNMSPTSNTRRCFHPQTRGEVGKTIDNYDPDGFPAWCPGIDLDKLKMKYQAARQHIGDDGECPLDTFDYDLDMRMDTNTLLCKGIAAECPEGNTNDRVLSCWNKYFFSMKGNG